MPEIQPPVPANSIIKGVYHDWCLGQEYDTFVEKTKQRFGDGSDDFFVATKVMESQQNAVPFGGGGGGGGAGAGCTGQVWAVEVGEVGEGAFGAVTKIDVPTLSASFAAKTFKNSVSHALRTIYFSSLKGGVMVVGSFVVAEDFVCHLSFLFFAVLIRAVHTAPARGCC